MTFLDPILFRAPSDLAQLAGSPRADAPIGLFDSGVGGFTVARALRDRLPEERVIYLADQAHVPYGGRPLAEVRRFAASLSGHLYAGGAKAVIMACNISSATALESCRPGLDGRIFGMIGAGARAARHTSATGRIGVLATLGTVETGAYPRALLALGAVHTEQVPCPAFVPLIEAGQADSDAALDAARGALLPLLEAEVDTVILGCTHYPLMQKALETVAGGRLRFVDPAHAVVVEVEGALAQAGLLGRGAAGPDLYATTGDPEAFEAQLKRLGQVARAEKVIWSRP